MNCSTQLLENHSRHQASLRAICRDWSVDDFVQVLENTGWLHKNKLTSFFTQSLHDCIPAEWLEAFDKLTDADINTLIVGDLHNNNNVAANLPASLQKFFVEIKRLMFPHDLRADRRESIENVTINKPQHYFTPAIRKGMTVKKEHEVACLVDFVHELCQNAAAHSDNSSDVTPITTTIVDIGAGLGHVDRILAYKHGYRVLGFEGDEDKTQRAREMADSFSKATRTSSKLSFTTLRLTNSTPESACETINSALTDAGVALTDPVMLIGLHCCGDLSKILFDVFNCLKQHHRRRNLQIVCIGCCYHLITIQQHPCQQFPLSKICRQTITVAESDDEFLPVVLLNKHSMRLATQGSKAFWFDPQTNPDEHILAHFYRCLFDYVCSASALNINNPKRTRRHAANLKHYKSFEIFIDSLLQCYDINVDADEFRAAMHAAREQFQPFYKHLRVFRALQGAIQRMLESFIVWDRMLYAQEMTTDDSDADDNVEIVAAFDSSISPRNLAVIAKCTTAS